MTHDTKLIIFFGEIKYVLKIGTQVPILIDLRIIIKKIAKINNKYKNK